MRVVSYQAAYVSGVQLDLCDACVAAGRTLGYSLGPVSHGAHDGECLGCATAATDAAARASLFGAVCPVCGDPLPEASRDRRVAFGGLVVCGKASCEERAASRRAGQGRF